MLKQAFGNVCPVCGGEVKIIDIEYILEYNMYQM